jgi:predicted Rossmann fold nucleotide-binding protein DprA/Smf involved in DNA uptake
VTDGPIIEFSDDETAQSAPRDAEAPARRGRPRSRETLQRDEVVLKALSDGPKTKEQLVEELKLKDTHVYLSLWRLRRDGQVERVSSEDARHLWQAVA